MALRLTARRVAVGMSLMLAPLVVSAQPSAGSGFMFGAPGGSVTLRAGFARPTEGSDVFGFVQKELTLGRGDFAGGTMAADVSWFLSQRVALQLGGGFSSRTTPSVYRKWVDNNDREIEQSTTFLRVPLSVGARYYLAERGRSLGELAWVPAKFVTYVGAGAGITGYQFRQTGDFVDYQTLDVFPSTMESSGWTPSLYGAFGVEYALSARLGITGEARYDYARARMSSDFLGFDRIDVSGAAVTFGLTLRF